MLSALEDAFLVRTGLEDNDPRWVRFYDLQMTVYMHGKRNTFVSLPEGDMVTDLIRDCWESLREYLDSESRMLPVRDLDNIFRSVHIDFPWL